MTAVAFDTYKMIKRLTAAGMPEQQTEAVTTAVQESESADLSNLVTKDDLKASLADIRLEIERSKNDVLRWVIPLILAQMALTVGMLLKLPH